MPAKTSSLMTSSTATCRICRSKVEPNAEACFSCGAVVNPSKAVPRHDSPRTKLHERRGIAAFLLFLMFIVDGAVSLFLAALSAGGGAGIFLIFLCANVACWIAAAYCLSSKAVGRSYAFALLPVPGAILLIYAISGIRGII